MDPSRNGNGPHLRFESASDLFLQQLRAALQAPATAVVTIDMTEVAQVDTAALAVLAAAGEAAAAAGKPLYLEGARPSVYKAIQIAKLGAGFRRVHHG